MAKFDLSDYVTKNAPALLNAAGGIVGSVLQQGDNRDAAAGYNAGLKESADILNKGYDAQLGHIEGGADTVRQYLDAGLKDVTDYRTRTGTLYGQDMGQTLDRYGNIIAPAAANYGNTVQAAAGGYGNVMFDAAGNAIGMLDEGSAEFEDIYNPYTESGKQALQYISSILGMNPEEMTPSQKRMYDDYRRSAFANLAASGLRGAGRGGVAAVNEGEAELMARIYDQNQSRKDAAGMALMNQGYSASGNVANNVVANAGKKANLLYTTAADAAGKTLTASQEAARANLAAAESIGNKTYSTGSDVAGRQYETGKEIAGDIGGFYTNAGNTEASRYQARADTAMGKANVNSAATTGVATTNFNTAQNNAAIGANALGNAVTQVTGTLGSDTAATAKKEAQTKAKV